MMSTTQISLKSSDAPSAVHVMWDTCLVERIKAGEPAMFHDLIRPYERGLYLVAYSIVGKVGDAEEVVQATARKALAHLNQLPSSKDFRQWLFQTVVREARIRRRKYRQAQYESIDQNLLEDGENDALQFEVQGDRQTLSHGAQEKELQVAVRRAVTMLPPVYRETCMLRDVEHLNVEEVAHVLGISVPAAKTRCHRGRIHLLKTVQAFLLWQHSIPTLPQLRGNTESA